MNQEENIIVDKIQDTLPPDKEDEVNRLKREIERTRDEIKNDDVKERLRELVDQTLKLALKLN